MLKQDQKVVDLLRLLGGDVAESVLTRLRPERASQIRKQLSEKDASALPTAQDLQILEEFERVFALLKSTGGRVKLHRPENDGTPSGRPAKPVPAPDFKPSGDDLADLERIGIHQLAAALESEQPRTVAALLNELSPERAAETLSLFEDDVRGSVVRELSNGIRPHPALVERMAQSILARAITMPSAPVERPDRVQRLASVLRAVDKPLRKKMLEAIKEQDAETAEGLMGKMYSFEDLQGLKDRQIQKLLAEVDSTTISTALFGSSDTLKEKVLGNLSRRARDTLMEEMQFQGELPEENVTAARATIARAIAKLDEG